MKIFASALAGLALLVGSLRADSVSSPFGVWAYMGRMPTLSAAPFVRGKLVRAAWADLEPQPGVWRWDQAGESHGVPGVKTGAALRGRGGEPPQLP